MSQVLDLVQGSEEWLAARRNYGTASETPSILRIEGAFQTPAAIRRLKKGGEGQKDNFAMAHGRKYEEVARLHYCANYGEVKPVVMVDGKFLASLDGISEDGSVVVEIKAPPEGSASNLYLNAMIGIAPLKYVYQIQHQLMVSGAKLGRLYIYASDIDNAICIDIQPDEAIWSEIKSGWEKFWEGLNDRDDDAWRDAAEEFKKAHEAAAAAAERLEKAKAALKELAKDDSVTGCGVSVTRIEKKGSIDYKAGLAALAPDADLEKFRKQSTIETRVGIV